VFKRNVMTDSWHVQVPLRVRTSSYSSRLRWIIITIIIIGSTDLSGTWPALTVHSHILLTRHCQGPDVLNHTIPHFSSAF
jgi:hypothetical protein